ncbi:hypothetical protein RHSIM_Rhsim01G0173000 [Rhododendron simsii]|uniref:Protein FAR1-RELATED SEQUENCE n=1 Tax=Rhododendron simsii TaxID=118357 RepID=A0A834LZG1_RHOSS|nr:hypothetical protein RHSIM_Rhsim01G0173000 [Rhododendron simsii]
MELEALDDLEVRDTETPDNNIEGFKTPTIGMYFETIEEVRNYYECYGRENGFWIRTWGSEKGRNRSNEVTKVRFVCTKEGKYAPKNQQEGVQPLNVDAVDKEENVIPKKRVRNCSTVKCGCKAYLRIMHDKWNCKWKVTGFDESHNHPLVTPSKRMKMKSNRNMPKAVKDLTETFHRESIDISKVPSIFGVYYKRSKFKKDMKECIRRTYKKEDFEKRWMLLMKENGLESNQWLQGLFDIRESWVPVYNRGTFFAGMNTTGRSEGINSFFDGFVTHMSNLTKFVVKYDKALSRIVRRENDEDFETEHKFWIVNDHEFLLKHEGKVYTRNVFNKFKAEWSKVFHYKVENVRNDNGFQSFVVNSKEDELEKFEVTLDLQTYEGMNALFEKIQAVSKASPIEICAEKDNEKFIEPSPSQILLLDLNISICKGRKKDVKGKAASTQSERLKNGIEMSLNKKKRKCHMCFQFGHDKRSCPSNPIRKTNKDLEEEAEGSDSNQEEDSDCSE